MSGQTKKGGYVYILGSRQLTIYVGVTNNLERRMWEHKNKVAEGFTKKYNIHRLLYFEQHDDIRDAITREKTIKKWRREKKLGLIEITNGGYDDLAASWFEDN